MNQTRYEVMFRNEIDGICMTDMWAKDETVWELSEAVRRTFHRKTEIIDIRKVGVLMEVK